MKKKEPDFKKFLNGFRKKYAKKGYTYSSEKYEKAMERGEVR